MADALGGAVGRTWRPPPGDCAPCPWRGSLPARLARMLVGVPGNKNSRQLARGPDVSRRGDVDRFIERASLDADPRVLGCVTVPNARATDGTKIAAQAAATVGGTGPAFGCAARQGKGRALGDHR